MLSVRLMHFNGLQRTKPVVTPVSAMLTVCGALFARIAQSGSLRGHIGEHRPERVVQTQ
jgi:hypothetical protein